MNSEETRLRAERDRYNETEGESGEMPLLEALDAFLDAEPEQGKGGGEGRERALRNALAWMNKYAPTIAEDLRRAFPPGMGLSTKARISAGGQEQGTVCPQCEVGQHGKCLTEPEVGMECQCRDPSHLAPAQPAEHPRSGGEEKASSRVDFQCDTCGHRHVGRLGGICIGCPCERIVPTPAPGAGEQEGK